MAFKISETFLTLTQSVKHPTQNALSYWNKSANNATKSIRQLSTCQIRAKTFVP
ncbi:uncharacterized protein PHALS_14111 [Plasmopara halstedii]|uniref:Uncharacterized protein n=1 Tax=Plasmopara halstedii TaxID=4781 RepID=A0A0P1AR37_PLAHL|nr:uncharacterized protein PHALS_14111 [Plasmopara halstedii]CEG43822.1 hypothetical protein PHALS_14111 [Plasmopara halstedii]|eukprot:XP_024580191.1 hypothetical protein PHALS_14111 [Plasmopara halstedii]